MEESEEFEVSLYDLVSKEASPASMPCTMMADTIITIHVNFCILRDQRESYCFNLFCFFFIDWPICLFDIEYI